MGRCRPRGLWQPRLTDECPHSALPHLAFPQGVGRFCPKCDYGHILRLATFNDMKQSKVPEFAAADARAVNEIPAFALLEQLPVRLGAAHQCIELVVSKMRQLRTLLEELHDLHALTTKNMVGVDADTKALMIGARLCGGGDGAAHAMGTVTPLRAGLLEDYPTSPSLKRMWCVHVRGGSLRPPPRCHPVHAHATWCAGRLCTRR